MKNIALAADTAMDIPGVLNIVVMNENTGEVLLQVDGEPQFDDVLESRHGRARSQREMNGQVGSLSQETEDVLLFSDAYYHIIRPISAAAEVSHLLMLITLERAQASLPLARRTFAQIVQNIVFSTEELGQLKALG